MNSRWKDKTTTSHGFDTELIRYDFDGAPEDDVAAARDLLQAVNAPCPKEIAVTAITTLRARTKARSDQQQDQDTMLAIYASDVMEYPADIVVEACRSIGRSQVFFPSVSEIIDACEWRVRERRLLLRAIREFVEKQ